MNLYNKREFALLMVIAFVIGILAGVLLRYG